MTGVKDELDLNSLITRLLKVPRGRPGTKAELNENEIHLLCQTVREIFLGQPNLLHIDAPVKICGDLHGQFSDLLRLFELGGFPPFENYLFLGDYVDRGFQGLETICLLFAFKAKFPKHMALLRGNHESEAINRKYGFYDECNRRFSNKLFKTFANTFNTMPIAAIVGQKIFCCHGGLSPDLKRLDQIHDIKRPCDVPDHGIMCDLLWADPDKFVRGYGPSTRGISYHFDADEVVRFLQRHDLDIVVRGHQVVQDGYEFFAGRQLVTVFSAPNYCGEFDNSAAMLTVDQAMECSFQILVPETRSPVLKARVGSRVNGDLAFYKPPQGLDSTEVRVRNHIESEYNIRLPDYDALHKFSCESYPEFWETIVKYFGIKFGGKYEQVIDKTKTIAEFPKWFEGATVNYTENILRGDDDQIAFVTRGGKDKWYSYRQLKRKVASVATSLRNMGVTPGDKICGFLPNAYETAVAMYATASIGATWSSSSVENGVVAVLSRFQQVKPKVLFTVGAVTYKGKRINLVSTVDDIVDGLPSLEKVIVNNYFGDFPVDVSGFKCSEKIVDFNEFADLGYCLPSWFKYERVPFAHPLFIMFSSGTTGMPKAIVHTYGGTLLKHVEEHMIQGDSRPSDKILFHTNCGWMMWNWLMSFPFCGGTVVLYNECYTAPLENMLLNIASEEQCTIIGFEADVYEIFRRNGQDFKSLCNLTNIRLVYSTGSPLTFVFINDHISPGAVISSISGGTDIIGCFMGGTLSKPVVAGECTALFLGMDIHCFDQNGKEVFDQKGELVCTTPFPSMPLHFLGDEGNKRYRKSYFEKFDGVWAHEDFCYISSTTGGVVMVGRSDSTLNRGGVRIGTAELYQVVETFDEITDSVVVGKTVRQENGEEYADEHIILFVQLKEGVELTDELKNKICLKLRSMQSPRHMPNEIFAIADIPYTKSGKKVELDVKKIVNGEVVEKSSSIRNPDSLDLYYPFA